MKRTVLTAAAAVMALVMLLGLAGCGRSGEFRVESRDDGTMAVTAQNVKSKEVGIGYVTVGEGQQLTIRPSLNDKSVLHVQVFPYVEPEDPENIEHALKLVTSDEGAVVSEDIMGTAPYVFDVEARSYVVRVTVVKKADGSMTVAGE